MTRHAFALVLVVTFAILPSRKTCLANEGDPRSAETASDLFPERLLPLIDDLDVQLQLTYGASRPVLRGRVQYTLQVIAAWQGSGRTPDDEVLFEGWLREAIGRSTPGRREPLAPMPAFSRAHEDSAHPEVREQHSAPVFRAQAGNAAAASSNVERRDPPLPIVLTPPVDEIPSDIEPPPAAVTPPREPPLPIVELSAKTLAGDEGAPALAADPAAGVAEVRSSAAIVLTQPAQAHRPDGAPRPDPVAPRPDPQTLDVRPAAVQADGDDPSPGATADPKFNVREYAVRLAGHRRGLRHLEARLIELKDPTAGQLAALVSELERLTSQATLLDLYATLLPPELLAAYGQPASARAAIDTLEEMIALRRAAPPDDGRGGRTGQDGPALDPWANLADRIDRLSDARGERDVTP